MKKKLNKKNLLLLLSIVGIIVFTLGITVAFFTYIKKGSTENTISSGKITFLYTETSGIGNGITLTDAMPMDDSAGKVQTGNGKVFDFQITSTSGDVKIPYEITARKVAGSDNLDNYIKVYLTKVSGNTEQPVVLSMFNNLNNSTNDIAVKNNEKTIHTDVILPGSNEYTENYRLRLWLNNNPNDGDVYQYNQTVQDKCSIDTYLNEQDCVSNNGKWESVAIAEATKEFSIKINVYANGEVASSEEIVSASSVGIRNISIDGDNVDEDTTSNDYDFYKEVEFGTDSASIEVDTLNEDATVEVTKINGTAYNYDGKIKRLSTIEIIDIDEGDNFYNIKVTSQNKAVVKEYTLKVTMLKSKNANLSSLSITKCNIGTFDPNTTTYSCTASENLSTAEVNAVLADNHATITSITGNTNMPVGTNTIRVNITAQDTNYTKTYTITVTNPNETINILGKNYQVSTAAVNLRSVDKTSSTSKVYKSTDTNSGKPTYYFRGNVTDNYVNFANKIWRIVRVNEDGTIRLRLNTYMPTCSSYSGGNNKTKMYYTNNTVKSKVDSWYNSNINVVISGSKRYSDYVATGNYFCQAARVAHNTNMNNSSKTGTSMPLYSSYNPTYKCTADGNGYGLFSASVALITYDEVVFAGIYPKINNTSFYIYSSSCTTGDFTMSPSGFDGGKAVVWLLQKGNLTEGSCMTCNYCEKPVINLKANVTATGNGTSGSPFVIQYN